MSEKICELLNITRTYKVKSGFFSRRTGSVKALDNVSISIGRGEILGLVGESGCGKTTLAKIALGLERPESGQVMFDGVDIGSLDRKDVKTFRRRSQMVFQDPFSSLNPKKTVFQTLMEPLLIHNICNRKEGIHIVERLLNDVGLDMEAAYRWPHEFSGGQRQRIGIARALATSPEFIIADEPTSALDVSIQAQIINLLLDIQEQRGFSILFISHDLHIVRFVSHRVAIMYKGQLMELMESKDFSSENDIQHIHPYTLKLLDSAPVPNPDQRENTRKSMPQPEHRSVSPQRSSKRSSKGCAYAPRCPSAIEICWKQRPVPKTSGKHTISCHVTTL
jgi:ABC-type oligopeptide transport system ATPase subunit